MRAKWGVLFECFRQKGVGVEVGVRDGDFAREYLKDWQGLTYLVDPWRVLPDYPYSSAAEHEVHYQNSLKLASEKVKLLRLTSQEAAPKFAEESLDWVYLDANHSYEAVKADLALWLPKVRPGGLVAGHDFLEGEFHRESFGVKRAVEELAYPLNLTQEEFPSWFFVK